MKKIFLLVCITAFSLLLNSCSSDDSNSTSTGGRVTFKINGVSKTLTTTTVTTDAPDSDGDVYVYAAATDGGANNITIEVYRGYLGNYGYATFFINNNLYNGPTNGSGGTFFMYFTQNDEHHLKGTFSGIANASSSSNDDAEITEGTFDITY